MLQQQDIILMEKWNKFYKEQFGDHDVMERFEKERQMYQTYGVNQIKKYYKFN